MHLLPEEIEMLQTASTFKEMREIAACIIERLGPPFALISGPITSGGFGSREIHFKIFQKAYTLLDNRKKLFRQYIFQDAMYRCPEVQLHEKDGTYAQAILTEFYDSLVQPKWIDELIMLPRWETSRGARWEYEQARSRGIAVSEFPEDLVEELLSVVPAELR